MEENEIENNSWHIKAPYILEDGKKYKSPIPNYQLYLKNIIDKNEEGYFFENVELQRKFFKVFFRIKSDEFELTPINHVNNNIVFFARKKVKKIDGPIKINIDDFMNFKLDMTEDLKYSPKIKLEIIKIRNIGRSYYDSFQTKYRGYVSVDYIIDGFEKSESIDYELMCRFIETDDLFSEENIFEPESYFEDNTKRCTFYYLKKELIGFI